MVAFGETGTSRYLEAAKCWIAWYEAHLNADGTIYDFDGSAAGWIPTRDYDSTDSYAATYLDLVLATYCAAPNIEWLQARRPAVHQAVAAICLTLQPNGLTNAKLKWPVMYVMDNTETVAGLRATEGIGRRLGDRPLEQQAKALADKMEQAIAHELWDSERQSYFVGLQANGKIVTSSAKWYPYAMANLMAIAWLPATERQRLLLAQLKKQFATDIPAAIHREDDLDHLVWWGLAARGVGDHELWREVSSKLAGFDAQIKQYANPGLLGHLCRILVRH